MHKAYGAIVQHLGEIGEQPESPAYAAYYNMDMQNLDVEMGFPVSKQLPGKNDVKASNIPAGKYASSVFTGPYSEFEPAYNALSQWIKENGYEVTGTAYELYQLLNSPARAVLQATGASTAENIDLFVKGELKELTEGCLHEL
jgi:effector-binding domain-containing protein